MTSEEKAEAFDAETARLEEEAAARTLRAVRLLLMRYHLPAIGEHLWERHRLEGEITQELTAALDSWEQARAGVLEDEGGSLRRLWVRRRRR